MLLPLLLMLAWTSAPSRASDTADSADPVCLVAQGDGCHRDRPLPKTCEGEGQGEREDDTSGPAVVEGGGLGCGLAGGRGVLAVLLSMILLFRRRLSASGVALSAGLLCGGEARAADAQHLQDVDGGTFLSLQEPRFSAESGWRFSLATSYAASPVVLRSGSYETPYLSDLVTVEPAALVDVGRFFQLGVVWPVHLAWLGEEPAQPVLGDLGLRVGVPLFGAGARDLSMSWSIQADLPRGGHAVLLGDKGAIQGTLAVGWPMGELEAAANLGLRLQESIEIPGSVWGNRVQVGFGLSRETFAKLDGSLELIGSMPAGGIAGGRALFPLEVLGGLRRRTTSGNAVRLAAGAGLGAGLGTPTFRLVFAVDAGAPLADRDHDGLVDLRDACPRRPEDIDRFRDRDGCPEPDNDRDGLLDPADACPVEAETYNRFQDEDGCPDALTVLRLRVRSANPGGLERATVIVGTEPARGVLADEVLELRLEAGELTVRASAEGHLAAAQTYRLNEPGVYERELVLIPEKQGQLTVQLRGEGGRPLAGAVEIDGALSPVPEQGVLLTLPIGATTLLATAPQHAPVRASAEVSFRGSTTLVLDLVPVLVDRRDAHITLSGELGFSLDQAALRPEDLPLLDALAAWLLAHPELRLLRVEGHADEVGSPAYNYDLSLRRANAVRDALIARGVEPERLQPIGSGESLRPEAGQPATRRVEFLALIWDEGPTPEPP